MAATWTQADVDQLAAAISSGVMSVHYAGPPARTVTYQFLGEMRKALADMVAQVGDADGSRTSYRLGSTSKGV